MRRYLVRILGVTITLLVIVAGWAYWQAGRIDVEKVADGLYMMTGAGGNVGVLVTDSGVVVVDTMTFVRQGEAIRARIAELTSKPVVAVINTHYHLDHTHGNPAFDPGTKVVATEHTLRHLLELDAGFWKDPPAKDLLPNDTFSDQRELEVGGETLRILHPGRGHTDGDLVVLFTRQRVLHAGDLFFNGHYPSIDLEAGGTVRGWGDTLDRVFTLDFDGVIPGHGPYSNRQGLERFQAFMRSLWKQTAAVVESGGTLDDAKAKVDLREFPMRPLFFAPTLNRSFVIRCAYEEASR